MGIFKSNTTAKKTAITKASTKKTSRKRVAKKIVAKVAVPPVDTTPEPSIPEKSTMGRYFGFTIQHGQNLMFADNGPGGMELTDKQMTVLWTVNWSKRNQYRESQITGARRDYNKGKHGIASRHGDQPKIGRWVVDTKTNERTYLAAG
jgi:hypothetical protein